MQATQKIHTCPVSRCLPHHPHGLHRNELAPLFGQLAPALPQLQRHILRVDIVLRTCDHSPYQFVRAKRHHRHGQHSQRAGPHPSIQPPNAPFLKQGDQYIGGVRRTLCDLHSAGNRFQRVGDKLPGEGRGDATQEVGNHTRVGFAGHVAGESLKLVE